MTGPANRAFLLTPPGGAAIAVVRLTGPAVAGFLRQHFSKRPRPGRAAYGELCDGERVLDDPVVVISVTPEGGDVADLCLHGGPWVVRSVLELARRGGFETAPPVAPGAALPPAAVDGDDELQREMLAHLPLALTETGVRALLAQPAAWAELQRSAAAGGVEPARWVEILNDRSLWWLLHPPRVAIVGPPNVGKSTLANQLFAQERSVTADLPGTTRDWVGEVADVNGLPVMLVDTPGLRETADPIEASAISRAEAQIDAADLVVLVRDAASSPEEAESQRLDRYPDAIRVMNKCDRVARSTLPPGTIGTVATRGDGVDALRRAIAGRFGCDGIMIAQPRWWTQGQREWVRGEG